MRVFQMVMAVLFCAALTFYLWVAVPRVQAGLSGYGYGKYGYGYGYGKYGRYGHYGYGHYSAHRTREETV